MPIKKIEEKEKKLTKNYNLPTELIKAKRVLDVWLESSEKFEGSLEWESEISQEIKKEISTRDRRPEKNVSRFKLKLSENLIGLMRSSDKSYAHKGYSAEWDSTLTKILTKLIAKNTKKLSDLFNESPPVELDSFHKLKNEPQTRVHGKSNTQPTQHEASQTEVFVERQEDLKIN